MALLHPNLHPRTDAALRACGIKAERVLQVLGSAPASHGYHAKDGEVDGYAYSGAVDLRTKDLPRHSLPQLMEALGLHGLAAFVRLPGRDGWPAGDAEHCHLVDAGIPIKVQLRGQVHDACHGRNGLAGHGDYSFHKLSAPAVNAIRTAFLASGNPVND